MVEQTGLGHHERPDARGSHHRAAPLPLRDMIEAARVIAQKPGAFWTDQLNNTGQIAAYHKMADEIWQQTGGRIDGFVQSVGTAVLPRGTAEGLRRHDARIKVVAVEPSESAVLSGDQSGAHKIDG